MDVTSLFTPETVDALVKNGHLSWKEGEEYKAKLPQFQANAAAAGTANAGIGPAPMVMSGADYVPSLGAPPPPAPPPTPYAKAIGAAIGAAPAPPQVTVDEGQAIPIAKTMAPAPHGLAGSTSGMSAGPAKPKGLRDYMGETFDPIQQSLMGEKAGLMGQIGYATQTQADAIARGAQAKSDLIAKAQAEAEAASRDVAKREVERQTFIQHAMDIQQQESDALAKQKIDPNAGWSNMSTAQKVIAAIGLMLAGIGAGATGGKNMAVPILEDAMNREIETQKANFANQHAAAANNRNIFADRMRAFGDERMAEASAKAEFWQGVQMKASALAAGTDSETAKAQAAKLGAEADLQINNYKQQIYDFAKQHVEAKDAQAAAGAAAAKAAEKKALDEQNKMIVQGQFGVAVEAAKANGGTPVPMIGPGGNIVGFGVLKDGQVIHPSSKEPGPNGPVSVTTVVPNANGEMMTASGMAMSKQDADEWKKQKASASESLAVIDQMIALREKYHGGTYSPEANAEAKSLAAQAKISIKAGTQGMSSDKDMATFAQIVPEDPLAHHAISAVSSSDPTMAKLKEARRRAVRMGDVADKLHLVPGSPGTASAPPLVAPK